MTNISDKDERNQLNLAIRQQPWYQDWFRAKGLDPNMVKLSDDQRKELQSLVVSKGFLDPSDGHIDPAGNVSDFHGWKGLPTAAKIAIGAGATAATLGAAGAFSGGAGVASAAGGSGAASGAGAAGATAAGAGAAGAGTTGSILGTLGMGSKTAAALTGLSTAGRLASGAAAQRAEDRGAQAEYDNARIPIQNSQSLQQAQMKRQAEADRLRQIGGADMLGNFKAPSDPRAQKYLGQGGQLSGGQINPETIALMRDRSMKALQSGSDVPQLAQMPEKPGGGATGMDSFLKALSMGSTALGGLRESGVLGGRGNDGGQAASVNAPADLEASIFKQQDEDVPWWSPLARRGN